MAYVFDRRPSRKRTEPRMEVIWEGRRGPSQGLRIRVWLGAQRYERRVGPNDWLTVMEAAAVLNTYPLRLYRLVYGKRLQGRRVGGVLQVPLSGVVRLLSEE